MEGRKPSSSSFTSDLFGAKDSSSAASSSTIFGSIFTPTAQAIGSESLNASETEKKHDSGSQALSAKNGVSEKDVSSGEGRSQSTTNKETNLYNQEQKAQPFHYSSSIYYGGQDVYSRPPTAPNPCFTTMGEKMSQAVPQEGTGGRGLFITETPSSWTLNNILIKDDVVKVVEAAESPFFVIGMADAYIVIGCLWLYVGTLQLHIYS